MDKTYPNLPINPAVSDYLLYGEIQPLNVIMYDANFHAKHLLIFSAFDSFINFTAEGVIIDLKTTELGALKLG